VQSERIRVLVVDDHPLMREGIVAVIQGAADIIAVGEAVTDTRQSRCSAYTGRMSRSWIYGCPS
jgi:DNA-binding NarL/FixJ family response regulator